MTKDMCGIDCTVSCDAIPPRWGWRVMNAPFHRALPWAITFGAFGAEERPSPGPSHLSRLGRRKDVSRHGLLHLAPLARRKDVSRHGLLHLAPLARRRDACCHGLPHLAPLA